MSQPVEDTTTIEELLNEIDFQQTLLASIDDSVVNRKLAEKSVKEEIKGLEKQLYMKRGFTASGFQPFSSSQHSSSAHSNNSHIHQPSKLSGKYILSSGSAMEGHQG